MHIKVGDKIKIIAGKHKGQEGVVKKVFIKSNRVIISGINLVKKHVKPSQSKPDGGIVEKEAAIHASNVALATKSKVKKVLAKKVIKVKESK